MNVVFRICFLMLLLIVFTGAVNAEQGLCCYHGDNEDTIQQQFGTCGEFVEVGDFSTNPLCEYPNNQRGCIIESECYLTVFGNYIYYFNKDNNAAIKNYFINEVGVDLDEVCDSLVSDISNCHGKYENSEMRIITDPNNPGSDSDNTIIGPIFDPEEEKAQEYYNQMVNEQKYCSEAGGQFDLFLTNRSCSTLITSEGIYPCIYNPYLAGYLKTSSKENDYGIFEMELGCMAKRSIKNCYDYKTEENCVNNPVYNDIHFTTENLKSCKWVPSSDYFSLFDTESGICLSDTVNDEKHFNINAYSSRQNLIQNPSFEKGLMNWSGNGILRNGVYTYDGVNNVFIPADNSIKTQVDHIAKGIGYQTILYIAEDTSFTESSLIFLKIKEYDSNDNLVIQTVKDARLNDYNEFDGIFKRVAFNQVVTSERTSYLTLEFTSNFDIIIDAITFEKYDFNDPVTNAGLYKPLEIIDSGASICEVCFDEKNLNYCTENKSDLLGDCSYMVPDLKSNYESLLPDYLGKDENNLIENWSAQSIANSRLFCEMYLTQTSCEDPDNYVNKKYGLLHGLVKTTLCKWDNTYGCFKDSDNNGGPDTIDGGQVYLSARNTADLTQRGWSNARFNNYSYKNTNTKISDFNYACDLIPPHSYLYFVGKTQNNKTIIINENSPFPAEKIGNVEIYFEAYDIMSKEACKGQNFERGIYFDYIVGSNASYRINKGSLMDNAGIRQKVIKDQMNIKDYFFSNGKLLLEENNAVNNVVIMVKDQSGNVEKERVFQMNLDLNGPVISIVDPNPIPSIFGPKPFMEIDVTDYSNITSCTFTLDPYSINVDSNQGIDNTFFVASGNLSDYSDTFTIEENHHNYHFNIPINETTINENLYFLDITCSDIFGQTTTNRTVLLVDFNTDLILFKPQEFKDKELDFGFMNSQKELLAISSDTRLKECKFDFQSTDGYGNINVVNIPDGFVVEDYGETIFYYNITGFLGFDSSGEKDIQIICEDDLGNQMVNDYTYYYDDIKPELLDYSILSTYSSQKNVFKSNNKFYAKSFDDMTLNYIVNLSIDGTESWMKNGVWTLYAVNNDGEKINMTSYATFQNYVLHNDTFIGELEFLLNFPLALYQGIDQGNELYLQTFILNFTDKANNSNTGEFNVYFDNSNIDYVFAEPVFEVGNKLYTNTNNPLMDITFGTPEYRKYDCTLDVYYDMKYRKTYDLTSNLQFKFTEFIPEFDLEKYNQIRFDLTCSDIFGETKSESYTLKYDNTAPVLNNVFLEQGDHKYLPNKGQYLSYYDETNGIFTDQLVFDLTNTNEDNYNCKYQFVSSDYNCNNTIYESSSINSRFSSAPLRIFSLGDDYTSGVICYKKDSFGSTLQTYYDNEEDLNTQIDVYVECLDNVGFATETKTIELKLDYLVGNGFVDFDISYAQNEVIFKARSIMPFTNAGVYFDVLGNDFFASLILNTELEDGLYVYEGRASLSEFENSGQSIYVWALGFADGSTPVDNIKGEVLIDKIVPQINLYVPDANENDIVYSNEFEVAFEVSDLGGSNVGSVKLYIDDRLIYDSLDLENYENSSINEPSSLTNKYLENEYSYLGSVIFNRGITGEDYTFKVVAYDKAGNLNSSEIIVTIQDGVGIRLLDSANAFVDFDKYSWVTKVNAPILSFKTTKAVQECRLYPFKDEKWTIITGNSEIGLEQMAISGDLASNNIFAFDLSEFEEFILDNLNSAETRINIICKYNNTPYTYSRKLYFLNTLPDYVVTSSEGFILNENPYETTINIDVVSFYKYVQCRYSIDGDSEYNFDGRYDDSFSQKINFRTIEGSEHDLKVVCQNKVGIEGPEKHYTIFVNKDVPTDISNVELYRNNKEYNLSEISEIYIKNTDNFGISFMANKKGLSCYVEVDSSQGFFYNVIDFIVNLFVDNRINVDSEENTYYFNLESGINFAPNQVNILRVNCNDMNAKEYRIIHSSEQEFEVEINLI